MVRSSRRSCVPVTGSPLGMALRAGLIEALEPRQLLAADPITPDNPLWIAMPGTVTVDGAMTEAAWSRAVPVVRHEAFRSNTSVTLKVLYDGNGLYVGFTVQDPALWADGRGQQFGPQAWEYYNDDSMSVSFDPNNSRDEYMQDSDRAFGVNLSNTENQLLFDPVAVKLLSFFKGDGAGGSSDVAFAGVIPEGILYRTVLAGTPNNNSDTDTGWVTEMFFPWTTLNMAAPIHGQTIGMNFDVIFDNTGGERDQTDYRTANNGTDRFTNPAFIDDHVVGVESSYHGSQPGVRGPVNYAELMFFDPAAATKPARVTDLASTSTTGYGATLSFTAPRGVSSTQPGTGHVSGYEVRLSSSAIATEADWSAATVFENAYVPRLAGLAEFFRVSGLTPGTTYFVAVRALDAGGNLGDISNAATFTTKTTAQDVSGGDRLVTSAQGRTLVTESGEEFIPVGDHLGLSWKYTRNLYTGDVWNAGTASMINFNQTPSFEGVAAPYFDELQSKGVNFMRVFLEEPLSTNPPQNLLPDGTYWLEFPQGTYNDDMRRFMLNVLQQASARGIYVLFSPFETFSYDESFGTTFPWSAVRATGGMTNINNFFQDPETIAFAKARIDQLVAWLNTDEFKPYAHYMVGWEVLNEWDSYEWTLNAEGDSDPGRETEFRRRSQWVNDLASYIRQVDPSRLLFNSMTTTDPRGPQARQAFYSRSTDVLAPHFYTRSSDEPINNPDTDTRVRPAIDNANLTQYWINGVTDRRPVLNGEWGMTRDNWPGQTPAYSAAFTQAEDEAIFRSMLWSGLASGQIGTGLRIATTELNFDRPDLPFNQTQGFLLTDTMRNLQKAFATFVLSTTVNLDFANFNFDSLAGRIRVRSDLGKRLTAWGISDGSQGIAYIIQDTRQTTGSVTDGVINISGLRPDQLVDIEFWSTAAGTTAPLRTLSGQFVGDGTLALQLPSFSQDVVMKFKARSSPGLSQKIISTQTYDGKVMTFFLGADRQPMAQVVSAAGVSEGTIDIAALARFTGRVIDMTAFLAGNGMQLAVTDENHHVWHFFGNTSVASPIWGATDLTVLLNAPGITGDLTTYQPSWGTVHIAGIDARGHAINYWYDPATSSWAYDDLTSQFSGPTMTGGLTGYVSSWDGLNLAGLNESGEVIVYWWSPQESAEGRSWQTVNMTQAFSGTTFVGQLDAFVTSWGALNIAGRNAQGEVWAYWWSPADPIWHVANLTEAASAPAASNGVEVAFSADGGINVFFLDGTSHLQVVRWTPAAPQWTATDVTQATGGAVVSMPLASSSSAVRMFLYSRAESSRTLVQHDFVLDGGVWSDTDLLQVVEI